jgi:hypothetical protein
VETLRLRKPILTMKSLLPVHYRSSVSADWSAPRVRALVDRESLLSSAADCERWALCNRPSDHLLLVVEEDFLDGLVFVEGAAGELAASVEWLPPTLAPYVEEFRLVAWVR